MQPLTLLLTVLLALGYPVSAQLLITFPTEQTVFQRNPAGSVQVPVAGFGYLPFDRVEARLVALEGSLPLNEAWTVLATRLQHGSFSGSLPAQGGWYRLEVRGVLEGQPAVTGRVERVGVGEVFLVSGNSNAMGLPNLGAKSPSDQVLGFNAVNKTLNYAENIQIAPDGPLDAPVFTPLSATGLVYPTGETAWNWGELGDLLVQRLGVPVLFLNAAWPAANSVNWREAAEGRNAMNIYVGRPWPNRQPYSNLKNTLRYFHSWLGVRSILWSHGDNDALHLRIEQEKYFTNMQYLIRKTREDFGQNVPWVVSLTSVSAQLPMPYLPVVNAQKQLAAQQGFNVWPGPDTDLIQVPRPEHGHFENVPRGVQGISELARAWNTSLTDAFFRQVAPVLPLGFVHTGVVPSAAPPGSTFLLPYQLEGTLPATTPVQAELLTQQGTFVRVVGSGAGSPLRVTLPPDLPAGRYRLRVAAQQPHLPGSVSEPLLLDPDLPAPQLLRKFLALPTGQEVQLHWLMAIDPESRSMVVEKSPDQVQYQQLGTLPARPDPTRPQLYSFTDPTPDQRTVYYRIRSQSSNGSVSYSPAVAVFSGDEPPLFTVFPNPAGRGPVYLRTPDAEDLEVQLFDPRGNQLPVLLRPSNVLGLSELEPGTSVAPGVYTLRVLQAGKTHTQQLVLY
jgi:hypothetical protein